MNKVLVLGPESSGTKMVTSLLRRLGVDAIHRSVPYGLEWATMIRDQAWTDVVVVVRHGPVVARSQVEQHLPRDVEMAQDAIVEALTLIMHDLVRNHVRRHIVTYEAFVLNPEGALQLLTEDMEFEVPYEQLEEACKDVGDANGKWYGNGDFRDQRVVEER